VVFFLSFMFCSWCSSWQRVFPDAGLFLLFVPQAMFYVCFCVLCAFTCFFWEAPALLVHIVLCFGFPCLLVPGQTVGILVVQVFLLDIHSVAVQGKFAGSSH